MFFSDKGAIKGGGGGREDLSLKYLVEGRGAIASRIVDPLYMSGLGGALRRCDRVTLIEIITHARS